VSVVVPCRNERAHIEACLNSIVKQNLPAGGFEIIVVDGHSDDGTRFVLETLRNEAPNLVVMDNPERITAAGMNVGVRAASGEFVAILGAHTVYAPNYLEVCLGLMQEHPEADCVGGPIVHEGDSAFGRAVALAMSHPLGIGNALHRYPAYEGYAEGACFPMFRRRVFERIGLYDETLVRNQDDEFNARLAKSGGKVYLSPGARSVYRVRETPRGLFQQFFQYGYWRVAVLRRHRFRTSLRRFAPVLLWGVFAALAIAALLLRGPWIVAAIALPLVYVATIGVIGLQLAGLQKLGVAVRFPLAVGIMHAAYAFGFVWSFCFGGADARPRPAQGAE
jgi:glycosyltransferase involved in cell wall biosynthesis